VVLARDGQPTTTKTPIGSGAGNIDLNDCLSPTYIPTDIPVDPNGGTAADTKYTVQLDGEGRFTVCSPEHGNEDSLPAVDEYCLTR
jgi:hypothetical protein